MALKKNSVPKCAWMLADHLDAVLAAGEDLLKVKSGPPAEDEDPVDAVLAARGRQREAIERVRTLEVAIMARVMKARERAAELGRANTLFKASARLFVSATGALADAIAECGDSTAADFDTADNMMAYLRGRGLVSEHLPALPESAGVAATEELLVAERLPLGDLMDVAASFLDALEQHYTLYERYLEEEMTADDAAPELRPALLSLPPPAAVIDTLETRIETTLQAMFESKPTEAGRGWAPGSLMAALAQASTEADAEGISSAA